MIRLRERIVEGWVWVLVTGLVIAGVGIVGIVVTGIVAPSSPYLVSYGAPGSECGDDDDLVLDRSSGEALLCRNHLLPPSTPASQDEVDDAGDFTAAEAAQITDLAETLARDGTLDGADQRRIDAEVRSIAESNGYRLDGFFVSLRRVSTLGVPVGLGVLLLGALVMAVIDRD